MSENNPNQEATLPSLIAFFKIIAEPNRLKILELLQHNSLTVTQIQQQLDIPINLTSFHLRPLKKFGLISSKKRGLQVIYSLEESRVCSFRTLLNTFLCERCEMEGKNVVC